MFNTGDLVKIALMDSRDNEPNAIGRIIKTNEDSSTIKVTKSFSEYNATGTILVVHNERISLLSLIEYQLLLDVGTKFVNVGEAMINLDTVCGFELDNEDLLRIYTERKEFMLDQEDACNFLAQVPYYSLPVRYQKFINTYKSH